MNMLLRNRSLLVVGVAESVSGIGSWITTMAIFALVVFRGDGTVAQSSGIFLAALLPMLIVSPLAGWFCDRFDRKWLMIASDLLTACCVAGLIFVDSLSAIYVLLALQSTFGAMMLPARQSAVPLLVGRDDLTQANALLQQLAGIIKIGAPIFAGFVLTILDPHQAIVLDVVSYLASALILTRLPVLRGGSTISSAEAELPQPASTSVWRTLRTTPLLALLFGVTFLMIVVIMGFDVFSSVFTRDVLGGDESLFGLLIGTLGLGTVLATAWLMLRRTASNPWRDVVIGMMLLAGIPAAIALAPLLDSPALVRAVIISACFVGGLGSGFLNVQITTLLQLLAPEAQLGRISGVFQSVLIAGQLLALTGAPLIVPALLPMSLYFAVTSGILLLVALGTALVIRGRSRPARLLTVEQARTQSMLQ